MSTFRRFETDTETSACWHCAEPPATGRAILRVPLVDGTIAGSFCSFSCAKRWCLDTRHTEAIVNLVISNGGKSIAAAPPRHCFKRFGGPFEPTCTDDVQSLPPLGTPLKLTAAVQTVPTGGRQDSLFREFVKQRRYVDAEATPAPAPAPAAKAAPKARKKRSGRSSRAQCAPVSQSKPRRRVPKKVPSGTLAAFIVPLAPVSPGAAGRNPEHISSTGP